MYVYVSCIIFQFWKETDAEFKEFEPQLKFKSRLKYGWFQLKSNLMFQDLSRRSIEIGSWGI